MNSDIILTLLVEAEVLLRTGGEENWAKAIQRLREDFRTEPEVIRGQILALYGGAGSFNDIVLYSSNGTPLVKENIRLNDIKTEIHSECRKR
jgi:hypothetical protein